MGFAPSDNPHYAVATRIANGYTSHNAADVSKDIIGCIFGDQNSIAVADSVGAKTASNEASND
jgi:penicillin-binding protein 2